MRSRYLPKTSMPVLFVYDGGAIQVGVSCKKTCPTIRPSRVPGNKTSTPARVHNTRLLFGAHRYVAMFLGVARPHLDPLLADLIALSSLVVHSPDGVQQVAA